MKRKSANQGRDFDHKLSRKCVENTNATTIIVGDLNVKQLCRRNKYEKGLHTSLHNTGHVSRFVGFLAYKAERLGKTLIEIDERNTTKTCCACVREASRHAIVETRLIETETVQSIAWQGSYRKMLCGQAIGNLLIICEK